MFVNPIVGLNTIIGDAIAGGNWNGLLTSFDANDLSAHYNARLAANENMLQPGSAAWDQAYNTAITTGLDLAGGGAGILDTSKSNSFDYFNIQTLIIK